MSEPRHHALLPAGLPDVLPPEADHEAMLVARLMAAFADHGYQRVKPPLLEFEDTLLSGAGAGLAQQTFRVLDPLSSRTMAIRPDITPQVARIATTRLCNVPRPLRLAYAGQVARVHGSQLRPEREFGQVGVELIGTLAPESDAEVIVLAAGSLTALGITDLSVDLCVPTLVPVLCQAWGVSAADVERLRQALDRKDAAGVAAVGGEPAAVLQRLMAASGLAREAVTVLESLTLPSAAEPDRRRLIDVVRLVGVAAPDLRLTVDLVEYRGFEYQTGVSFTVFSRGLRGELGSGGRYRAGLAQGGEGEPATGFTLYTDTVVRAVPTPEPKPRVLVALGADILMAAQLRRDGKATVAALVAGADLDAEARRLRCDHILVGTELRPVV